MLSEGLDKLQDIITRGIKLLELKSCETDTHWRFDQQGKLLEVAKPIPPRDHTLTTIPSFVDAVKRYRLVEEVTVWVALDRIVCVINDEDNSHRTDLLTLPLEVSPIFKALHGIERVHQGQKATVNFFRHDLESANIEPTNTIELIRNLKWVSHAESTGQFSNTSAAMGNSVTAEVTSADNLPESVLLTFDCYPHQIDDGVEIDCTLFMDPEEQTLRLSPKPGSIEAAKRAATEAMRAHIEVLVSESAFVLVGTP